MSTLARTMIGAENLEKYKHYMSDQDQVFTYLESTSASYVTLYHQKEDCEPEQPHKKKRKTNNGSASSATNVDKLIVETANSGKGPRFTQVNETGKNKKNREVMKYAIDTHQVIGAEDDQSVLVPLVWTTPQ
jgi:hypothetical protein